MGDFNAKIGPDSSNTGYDEVMGGHGLGEMNDSVPAQDDTQGGDMVSLDLKQRNRLTTSVLQRSSEDHYKTLVSREHHLVAAKLKLS